MTASRPKPHALTLAVAAFAATAAHAQPQEPDPVRHVLRQEQLSPGQVREALQRVQTGGVDPDLLKTVRRLAKERVPGLTDEKFEAALRELKRRNPAELEEWVKRVAPNGLPGMNPQNLPNLPPTPTPQTPAPPQPPDRPVEQLDPAPRPDPPRPGGPVPTLPPDLGLDEELLRKLALNAADGRSLPEFGRETSPAHSRREKAMRALAAYLERHVGSLDEAPGLKQALHDLVNAGDDLKDANGNGVWEYLQQNSNDVDGFGDWLEQAAEGMDFKLPSFDLSGFGGWSWGGGGGGVSMPSAPSISTADAGESTWVPVVLFVVVSLGALVWWRYRVPAAGVLPEDAVAAGLGPWPVDPRAVTDRAGLVAAFEYLSVLRCGAGAKAWNHRTIAAVLSAAGEAGADVPALARGYELARYTPAGDPLPPADLAAARLALCQLAGVPAR